MAILKFLAAGVLLTLTGQFTFACNNYYYHNDSLPLRNQVLDLSALLPAKGKSKAYWSIGVGGDAVRYHDSLQKAVFAKPGFESKEADITREALQQELVKKNDFKLLSDYACSELHTGNKDGAVSLLEKLHTLHPYEHSIMVNLATAYEVTGKPQPALELLRKAITINPESHFGSEWIHVRILEQKVAANPDYTQILQLPTADFEHWLQNRQYILPLPADSLKVQLAYQLHQYIGFTSPPNDIIGQLVLDFADIVARHDAYEAAVPFYGFAANYAPSLQKKVTERKEMLKTAGKKTQQTFRWASIVWAVPLLAFVLIFIGWLRNRAQ